MIGTSIKVSHPAPRSVWKELVDADPDILVSQDPRWLDTTCRVGGYRDVSRLYETADGRRMLLPMVERTGIATPLHIQASMPPAWGMGGLIGASPRPEDIVAVFDDLRKVKSSLIHIRPNPLQARVWESAAPPDAIAIPRLAHVLDLTGGFERVWKTRFKSETRRRIRKALQGDLEVELDTTGRFVPVFYRLFEHEFARWARIQHEPERLTRLRGRRRDPIAKFQSLAAALGDHFRLWVATLHGRPAAAIIVLQGRNAHCTRAVMDEELARRSSATYLLHRFAIEDACAAGCPTYHLGESGTSRGIAQFKSSLGATPVSYAEYRLQRLPLTQMDAAARGFVKRVIGFRDA